MRIVTQKGRLHYHWKFLKLVTTTTLDTQQTQIKTPTLTVIQWTNDKGAVYFEFNIKDLLQLKTIILFHYLLLNILEFFNVIALY
jgi:hypothetical protein